MTETGPHRQHHDAQPRFGGDSTPGGPSRAVRGLRVTSLVRGGHAEQRGVVAVRRLLGVASAFGPQCALVITMGAMRGRSNSLILHVEGTEPEGWAKDVAWALRDVAAVATWRGHDVVAPSYVAEMRPARDLVLPPDGLVEDGPGSGDGVMHEVRRQRLIRETVPHATPLHFDVAQLLAGNTGGSGDSLGLVVRHRLTAAQPLEIQMLTAGLLDTWDPLRGNAHDYLGLPICLRTLWGRQAGPLPARVRAMARQHGLGIELVDLDPGQAGQAWTGGPLSLAGHGVPEGVALALLRVPTAGDAPFPGMRSEQPPAAVRPLDPRPGRTTKPVRIGRARTAEGRWVDVNLDLVGGLRRHAAVQGASGSGKSTLLTAVAAGVIAGGGSVTLLDPEGSTVSMALRQLTAEQAARVRLIRHGHAELDVPLNVMAGHPARLERACWACTPR